MAYGYGWDSVNKKKVYMGKYSGVNLVSRVYFGNNDAGDPRFGKSNTAGQTMHIGTGVNEYTFYKKGRGYLTVHADSFEEAWKQAKLLGYNKRNYVKR